MFHCLDLVSYSQHSFPPLHHNINFSMKKQKKMGEKIILSHVGSSRVAFE
jgi:hypothetical protein